MSELLKDTIKQFGGLKNDEDAKQIPFNYFASMLNFTYPTTGVLGLEKSLAPTRVQEITTTNIDGMFEYRFLDSNNILQIQNIIVSNGVIYKVDLLNVKTVLKSGLNKGLVTFAVFNDKLYIANGKNYVQVYDGSLGLVTEMGSPFAEVTTATGNPNGTYYYAITFVTAGGEEYIGSVSNTVVASNLKVNLYLPLGYAGTTSRRIYRIATGTTQLRLLTTISNNTDLTYLDDVADASLGTNIVAVNNELPKPYFIVSANQQLYGTVVTNFPTQIFITATGVDVFDASNYQDISNSSDDNTPIAGIGIDFSNIIVGSGKNMYILDATGSLTVTRANVGIKNGYSVKRIPAFADFPGGLMFLSTQNDIRVLSGLRALPVVNSIDNISSDNYAQNIRGSLDAELKISNGIYCEYYNYKYYFVINNGYYIFDIRTKGWTYQAISTESYQSQPVVVAVLNNMLYNGQSNGWIELEYTDTQYRGEDIINHIESAQLTDLATDYKFINGIKFWYIAGVKDIIRIQVTADDNTYLATDDTFNLYGGAFDARYFDSLYFQTDNVGLNYKVVNINKMCRWLKYRIEGTSGACNLQGVELVGQAIRNKE